MIISRTLLILTGFSIALYGVNCLHNPYLVQEWAKIELSNATALTEVRAMYGGFEITIGLYWITCGIRKSMITQGLTLMVFSFAGLASARLFGIYVENDSSMYNIAALTHESASALLALFFLMRRGKPANTD